MSLRAAIDAKCRDCIYDQQSPGTWREQVAACTATECSLWPRRTAATAGPLANPPRDPTKVTPEWLSASIGCLKSGKFQTDLDTPMPRQGVSPDPQGCGDSGAVDNLTL